MRCPKTHDSQNKSCNSCPLSASCKNNDPSLNFDFSQFYNKSGLLVMSGKGGVGKSSICKMVSVCFDRYLTRKNLPVGVEHTGYNDIRQHNNLPDNKKHSWAKQYSKTLVIDADTKGPSLARLFNIPIIIPKEQLPYKIPNTSNLFLASNSIIDTPVSLPGLFSLPLYENIIDNQTYSETDIFSDSIILPSSYNPQRPGSIIPGLLEASRVLGSNTEAEPDISINCQNDKNNIKACNNKHEIFIIDTPPGITDEHLFIKDFSSYCNLFVLIISTEDEICVADVRRQLGFLKRFEVVIVGVVINLSGFVCRYCESINKLGDNDSVVGNKAIKAFGNSTERIPGVCITDMLSSTKMEKPTALVSLLHDFNLEVLGELQMKQEIAKSCDAGKCFEENFFEELVERIAFKMGI
ncbi:Cytosolic Fe-S cluster assembly factor nubp1-B [Cucumispora dikerogammari]|nr:Cytosolic Fe-S cluster assembly factor nubp1-B [Cucumispora dikerogammari]